MTSDTIGLYIHIPFCTAKCGYCDFNSYAGHEQMIPDYTLALVTEAQLWKAAVKGRALKTVFFGGGTPSLNPAAEMRTILEAVRETYTVERDAEISLEANPGSVSADYLRELRDCGFNRISIGVQSFDAAELTSLDRIHSADDAEDAFRAAREAGFDNVNLDLIYGLPDQPMESWQRSLERALTLEPEHLSLYALTVEDGTPLSRDVARGRTPAPDADNQADQYEWTQGRMASAGYEHYEISNWAKPGRRCRHNLVYWQHEEYLGLGAGAHSFLNGLRFFTVLLPGRYIELVNESAQQQGGGTSMRQVAGAEPITPELAMADTVMLGLRLREGISHSDFRARYGQDLDALYGALFDEFTGYGMVERSDGHVRLTPHGRLLSNELFVRLLPSPSPV